MKHNIFTRGISCAAVLAVVLMTAPAAFAQEAECPDDVYEPLPEWFTSFTIEGPTTHYQFNAEDSMSDPQQSANSSDLAHEQQSNTDDNFDYDLETFAAEVFKYTNIIREENGLPAFESDSTLTAMAQARIDETDGLSHNRPDGSGFYTIFDEYEIQLSATGENIGGAGSTPENMARGFLQTEGHKRNVLNPESTYMGIGVSWENTIIGYRISVLQLFAKD